MKKPNSNKFYLALFYIFIKIFFSEISKAGEFDSKALQSVSNACQQKRSISQVSQFFDFFTQISPLRQVGMIRPAIETITNKISLKGQPKKFTLTLDQIKELGDTSGTGNTYDNIVALLIGHGWDFRDPYQSALQLAIPTSFNVSEFSSGKNDITFYEGISQNKERVQLAKIQRPKHAPIYIGFGHKLDSGAFRILIRRPLEKIRQFIFFEANPSGYGDFFYTLQTWQIANSKDGNASKFNDAYRLWRENLYHSNWLWGTSEDFEKEGDLHINHDHLDLATSSLIARMQPSYFPSKFGLRITARDMIRNMQQLEGSGYGHDTKDYLHLEKTGIKNPIDRLTDLDLVGIELPELTDRELRNNSFGSTSIGPIFHYRGGSLAQPIPIFLKKFEEPSKKNSRRWMGMEPISESLIWIPNRPEPLVLHFVHASFIDAPPPKTKIK